jgi:hypothetical protein
VFKRLMICNNTKEPEFITGLWSNEKWNFKDALQLSPNANILSHTDLEVLFYLFALLKKRNLRISHFDHLDGRWETAVNRSFNDSVKGFFSFSDDSPHMTSSDIDRRLIMMINK